MDPSALIFVALAVAWAVYLIPKALEHHEDGLRRKAVSGLSRSMRVLARREAGAKGRTDLVTARGDSRLAQQPPAPQTAEATEAGAAAVEAPAYVDVPARLSPAQLQARRAAARRATRRRRNVLAVLLVLLVGTGVVAALGTVPRLAVVAPVLLLAAWLVACRLMVRKERAVPMVRIPADRTEAEHVPAAAEQDESAAVHEDAVAMDAETGQVEVMAAAETGAGRWDPVQAPLPTYVSKPAAPRRTVRTIDLDSTGVWSSGRNASDSALAREAEQAERTARQRAAEQRRASGS
ncbi:MAG: hypothetical protein QM638_01340 [Nocardioides sp.]|uniref:divisome protein SepX/GlpR n=1 Tax=Nocardioides sp. TaxID=35761 RepID=UPI0039E4B75A